VKFICWTPNLNTKHLALLPPLKQGENIFSITGWLTDLNPSPGKNARRKDMTNPETPLPSLMQRQKYVYGTNQITNLQYSGVGVGESKHIPSVCLPEAWQLWDEQSL
jgi:hypothetical protein